MLSDSLVLSQDKPAPVLTPPGPKGLPLVGSLFAFRRDPIAFFQQAAREYGDVAHFRLAGLECFLLNRPEYIQDVLTTHQKNFVKGRGLERAKIFLGESLLTSEGEFHLRQRRLMQPAFHRQRVAAYGITMAEFAARLRERWQDGGERDILQEMMQVTLAIAAKTLFDADVEAEATEIGAALTTTMQGWPRLVSPWFFLLSKLPLPSNRRVQAAQNRLDATVLRMIHERRASGEDRGDLLSMLLLAQDEEGDGGGMTDKQVRDEVMTLFLAGHETTANALTWTWYLLSQYPAVEAKLHAEITSALGDRLPTAEDLPRLPYTRMILAESMRLYPPAWTVGRRALNDYEISPYRIPANAMVFMSPYVTHHDARFFPNPEAFDPERWTQEAQAARPKFSYFPFGGGSRQCIGEAFAWMEGVLVIATIAQRWRLRLVPGHRVEKMPLITLRPKHGMRMIVERR
ncbi:MAG: cytochrome P450 [Deltaproteobacteria bacterium]|nr:cytochrome P450 [Deltaproteobacteria bacterium]